MPARQGLLLVIFSLIASLGHHWRLAGLQAVPPEWMPAITLLGVLGLSALLVGPVWTTVASGLEPAWRPETHSTAVLALPPQGEPDATENAETLELLRGSGLVDADWYIGTYPDVTAAGLEAANHYLLHGAAEGRNPNPFFETSWYLDQNPDVREERTNPLVHYIVDGAAEGRASGPRFDTAFYMAENADVTLAGVNPLAHYLTEGRFEGRTGLPRMGR